jgi:hypothetical protein
VYIPAGSDVLDRLFDGKTPEQLLAEEMERVNGVYSYKSQEACRSVERILNSWTEWVKLTGSMDGTSYLSGHYGQPPEDILDPKWIPSYHLEQLRDRQEEENERNRSRSRGTRRGTVWFHDPQPIRFDPEKVFIEEAGDDCKGEGGVRLKEVWDDPLARTLWLGIKARHLTSGKFRPYVIETARELRERPPRTAGGMYLSTGDWTGTVNSELSVQLYPYVVRILIDEGKWPYFHPGRQWVANGTLGWVTEA